MADRDAVPLSWLRPLVRRLLGPGRADVILGDLEEGYRRRHARRGAGAAARWYRADLARTVAAVLVDRARNAPGRFADGTRVVAGVAAADARFALRSLRRRSSFTAISVLLLAAGVGGATSLLSLVDGLLLRPLPYPDPSRLVALWARTDAAGDRDLPLPAPAAAFLRDRAAGLRDVAFVTRAGEETLDAGDEPVAVAVASATPELFPLLGARVLLGRLPDARGVDADGAGPGPLVLSEALWSSAFGRDPEVVGRTVRIDGASTEIAAVVALDLIAPASARLPDRVEAWLPLPAPLERMRRADGRLLDQDSDNTGLALARLAPGAGLAGVRADLDRLGGLLRDSDPTYAAAGLRVHATSLANAVVAPLRPLARVLSLGAILLLVVAAANVSTLILVQTSRRRRELAIRTAVGAHPARLRRQLLLEAGALVAASTTAAWALAALLLPALVRLAPTDLPRVDTVRLSLPALAAAAVVAAAMLAALTLTALRGTGARPAAAGLRSRRGAVLPMRARAWLVTAQVSLCLLFLVTAGLLGRTVATLQRVETGFVADGVLTFQLSLRSPERWRGPAERARFVFDLARAIEALPGARTAGVTAGLPLSGASWSRPYGGPGQPPDAWSGADAEFRAVTSGYFAAMGTRVVAGRGFTADEDLHEKRRVVVVDETLAASLAPGGDVVGVSIGVPVDGDPVDAEIVGVVEQVRQRSLHEPGPPTVYVPFRQEASRDIAFAVRTDVEPADLLPAVRSVLTRAAPELAMHDVRTLRQAVDADLAPDRFAKSLAVAFALLAVVSAVFGLYALLAFAIHERRREIGLRKAVGASRRSILHLVVRAGLRQVAAGLVAGLAIGAAVVPWLRGLLYGVRPADPAVWTLSAAAVVGTAVVATVVPALRAAAVDPARALYEE